MGDVHATSARYFCKPLGVANVTELAWYILDTSVEISDVYRPLDKTFRYQPGMYRVLVYRKSNVSILPVQQLRYSNLTIVCLSDNSSYYRAFFVASFLSIILGPHSPEARQRNWDSIRYQINSFRKAFAKYWIHDTWAETEIAAGYPHPAYSKDKDPTSIHFQRAFMLIRQLILHAQCKLI